MTEGSLDSVESIHFYGYESIQKVIMETGRMVLLLVIALYV